MPMPLMAERREGGGARVRARGGPLRRARARARRRCAKAFKICTQVKTNASAHFHP